MQPTRRRFYDSFRAARGELDHLFSPMRSDEYVRRAVQRYIIPALSRQRQRSVAERLGRAQERSLFRTHASLVLQEARRRANAAVAAVALDVVFSEASLSHFAQSFEPTWIKDAVASCRTAEELRRVEAVLRRHEQRLRASGTAAASDGFLLTTAFGKPRAAAETGLRLGDDIADGSGALASAETDARDVALAAPSAVGSSNDGMGGAAATAARVHAAVAQPPSLTDLAATGGRLDPRWASAAERAAAGVQRLQRQQRDLSAGPNLSFTRYFLHQGLVRHEGELMQLYQAMRARPLDVSFRVAGGVGGPLAPHAAAVHALLQHRRSLHAVPWLPAAMAAYTLDTHDTVAADSVLATRQLLRSLARERLVAFQSLPSMLPVLFLDPQPGECVLDMCASPGSKSELVMDCMHASPSSSSGCGTGAVVANEGQASRLRALQERLRDAAPEVVVTRGRGQSFGMPDGAPSSTSAAADRDGVAQALVGEGLYDRVLVDAPCSGEGRLGRDALSWRLWHPSRGVEFFPLQCALLHRAARLCRLGGRVVYATCTLNPLENEAVVAAVLRQCGGALHLVPPPCTLSDRAGSRGSDPSVSGAVPALRLSPGLRRWDVPSSAGGFLRTAEEAYARGESASRLPPDLFFGACHAAMGEAELSEALHRCCRRVMPHLNGNADGFFVAVLEKRVHVPHQRSGDAAGASAALLSSPSAAAAAPLTVSLAGGSNLLAERGLVRLPPTHQTVQRHLAAFFAASSRPGTCASVQSFLDKRGWAAVWCEGEGLRLVAQATVQLLRRHATLPASPSAAAAASSDATDAKPAHRFGLGFEGSPDTAASSPSRLPQAPPTTELLEAGVLILNAAGALTERGAALLSPDASHRVVSLPLPYAQLLLSNRTLDVAGSLAQMPPYMQEAEHALAPRHGLVTTTLTHGVVEESATAWYREALAALAPVAGGGDAGGNAIVTIDVASTSASSASAAPAWAAPLAQWAWPVRVEVIEPCTGSVTRGAVRLHLALAPAARHRTQALLGRLQSHAHKQHSPQAQCEQLHASTRHEPALVMGRQELSGVLLDPAQQHLQLFGSPPRRSPTSDGGLADSADVSGTSARHAASMTQAAALVGGTPAPDVFEL